MNYLFVGEETQPKESKLKTLKNEILAQRTAEFNCDTLFAPGLTLKTLQEKLKFSPAAAQSRMIIIRQAGLLKDDIKDFIASYLAKPYPSVTLILDTDRYNPKDIFIQKISRFMKVYRSRDTIHADSFVLHRQIELKRADSALKLLRQLLEEGQKPEMILGGLRYCWSREVIPQALKKRKLKALLNCDIEIKTGRLRADFALEKLVLKLCSPGKPFS
jgi:DNA polymerase III delta subunit